MKRLRIHFLLTVSFALLCTGTYAENTSTLPKVLTLDKALELTAAHNPTILKAQQDIRAQKGVRLTARAASLPRLDFVTNYTKTDPYRIEGFGAGSIPDDDHWSAEFQVTQSLYSGGKGSAKREAENARLKAARALLNDITAEQSLAAIKAYQDVLLAKAIITVREDALAVYEQQLTTADNRLKAGSGAEFDVLRARVTLANARPPLIRAVNDYANAVDDLRQIIGLPYPTDTQPQAIQFENGALATAPEWTLHKAMSIALENRHDLTAEEQLIKAADADTDKAWAGYLPTLDLLAAYGWEHQSFGNKLENNLEGWRAGLTLNIPIFDFGDNRGQVMAAKANYRSAKLNRDQLTMQIEGEVRTAFAEVTEAREILETATLVIEQAQDALRIAENRYAAGRSTQLEVQQTQLDLTTAKLERAQAEHQYQIAVATLLRSTGMLVK